MLILNPQSLKPYDLAPVILFKAFFLSVFAKKSNSEEFCCECCRPLNVHSFFPHPFQNLCQAINVKTFMIGLLEP